MTAVRCSRDRSCHARGCTCPEGRAASRTYHAQYRQLRRRRAGQIGGRVDALPTIALVRSLLDQGGSNAWIADHARVGVGTVSRLRRATGGTVHARVAARIEQLARQVAVGDAHPPHYADAERRRQQRQRRARYRSAAA